MVHLSVLVGFTRKKNTKQNKKKTEKRKKEKKKNSVNCFDLFSGPQSF